ncbi:MAG: hypothetical protein KDA80_24155 [Planctomycetaceae bacterium]|nr:hypothetical protein [Planctomycetaceae bacterium]
MDKSKTLVDVKLALAEKCERLSKLSGSKPKRQKLANLAAKHRRQAEQLQRPN